MYRQEYNQNYGQHESYGQYAGYNTDSAAPSSSHGSEPRIVLDDYNSDLNFVIAPDGVTGSSLHKDGFEYMWAGARVWGFFADKISNVNTSMFCQINYCYA